MKPSLSWNAIAPKEKPRNTRTTRNTDSFVSLVYFVVRLSGKLARRYARAAGLPLAESRIVATIFAGTGSKRNGSIE